MTQTTTLTPAIIESLYDEALALAEDARDAFEFSAGRESGAPGMGRIALSCEALRTTTRMMHALAWLLNHRAYFAGELSESQLRRHGRLPPPQPASDAAQMALLAPEVAELVARSVTLYDRLGWLDRAWQQHLPQGTPPPALDHLRARIDRAFATG